MHEAIAKQEKARADELEHLRALNTAKVVCGWAKKILVGVLCAEGDCAQAAELAAQRQVASRNNGVRVAAAAVSRAQAAAGRAKQREKADLRASAASAALVQPVKQREAALLEAVKRDQMSSVSAVKAAQKLKSAAQSAREVGFWQFWPCIHSCNSDLSQRANELAAAAAKEQALAATSLSKAASLKAEVSTEYRVRHVSFNVALV